jgi:hypothetical protein
MAGPELFQRDLKMVVVVDRWSLYGGAIISGLTVLVEKLPFFLFSRFRIDNTDHIIDVNRNGQTGSEYDQVN